MDIPAVITFIEKVLEVHNCCINSVYRDFPGDPVVKTLCFQSLVGELRSHVPGWAAKKNKNKPVFISDHWDYGLFCFSYI